MRVVLLVVLVACSGCAGRSRVGSGVRGPLRDEPGLAAGRVYIPYAREHYDEYHDKGGIVALFSNDAERWDTETTDRETVGVVVIDLSSGACTLEKHASGRSGSTWPKVFALDRERVTPSGARITRSGGKIFVNATRPLVPDPKNAAVYVPESDAILLGGRLIDVVDDEAFQYKSNIARFGDRLFLPTHASGVLELTAAPIARVAAHVPPTLLPAEAQWLTPLLWKVGETIDGATLKRDGTHAIIDMPHGRMLLGDSFNIRVFEDRYAVAEGIIVDLKERHATTTIKNITRIAKHGSSDLLIEGDGALWLANANNGRVRPFEVQLHALGIDQNALVMHTYEREAIFVFDLATRTWRELSYARCVPKK